MRLESDLDPGNLTVPDISLMGCNTISGTVDGFSAIAADATTCKTPLFFFLTVKMEFLFKSHKYLEELLEFLDAINNEQEVDAEDLTLELRKWGKLRFFAMLLT